jgi:hypothetical protein
MTTAGATAEEILRRQRMPAEEIHIVVTAEDPVIVRRHLELHRERLGEWLEEQRRIIGTIERSLTGRIQPIPPGAVPRPDTAL